ATMSPMSLTLCRTMPLAVPVEKVQSRQERPSTRTAAAFSPSRHEVAALWRRLEWAAAAIGAGDAPRGGAGRPRSRHSGLRGTRGPGGGRGDVTARGPSVRSALGVGSYRRRTTFVILAVCGLLAAVIASTLTLRQTRRSPEDRAADAARTAQAREEAE